tara:strand:+ start:4983 stop:5297 length:315 start_codon:yes stop_codon:yes gene_type:complete
MLKKEKLREKMSNTVCLHTTIHVMRELLECAHYYEIHGFSPEDFVMAYSDIEEIVTGDGEYYNFKNLSWGQACNIILSNSRQYEDILKQLNLLFRSEPTTFDIH